MRRCGGVCAVIDVMKEEAGKKKTTTRRRSDRRLASAAADDEEEEADGATADKSKWMSTAQLWTGDSGREDAESEVRHDSIAGAAA
jgi:hypothetical protein